MSTEVTVIPKQQDGGAVVTASSFSPIFKRQEMIQRKEDIAYIIANVLVDGVDYGVMPNSGKKEKVLKKSGAEKMMSTFGLSPKFEDVKIVEDWTGQDHGGEPLFYYRFKCRLYRGDLFLGEADGSCNSWEEKHRYRWVQKKQAEVLGFDIAKQPSKGGVMTLVEPVFAIDKAEATGKFGQPPEYWEKFRAAIAAGTATKTKRLKKDGGEMPAWAITEDTTYYRIPNQNFGDVVNTCQKIGQKRAMVAAVLIVTNCSDSFTQDLEEEDQGTQHIHTTSQDPPPFAPDEGEKGTGKPAQTTQGAPEGEEEPLGATIPEELAIGVQKYRKGDPGMDKVVNTYLQDELIKIAGTDEGPKTFGRIVKDNPPKGVFKSREDAREHQIGVWLKMFGEIQRLRLIKESAVTEGEPAK